MLEILSPSLIRRAQEGEPMVVGALYERYQRGIYRYLYYRVGDLQTAEDLTSEVFLRMVEKLSSYSDQNLSFQAWLFQIARNLSIDHYRKMSVQNNVELQDEFPEQGNEPLEMVAKELTIEKLGHALAQLPENQRDVIIMRFVIEMPIGEVAKTLHKTEDSIKGLQRRALISLKDILVEWEVTYV
ncbi:MAG: sigma-70 family RNA polymerase sigma factor [Chloroflexota bacterium]|nr:MAG: sigma-70 family RNA polymerase sigma factor [Chloroflexota bacterium]